MSESNATRQVCVIGLGNMGSALADALLAKGLGVTVWNRTASKGDPLAAAGATVAASVVDATRAVDVLVICVTDHDANLSILATDGMDEAVHGKTLIQLSTMSAPESQALDGWARERGAGYLDGSILGYPQEVRERTLRFLFSGAKAVFEDNRDVIDALTDKSIFIGEKPGTALLADKFVYAQFYGMAFAYLHAAAMAAAAGISIGNFRKLTGGDENWRGRGKSIEGFLEMIERQDYSDAECTLEVHAAAYAHVVRISRDLDVGADFPALVAGIMAQGIEQGHSRRDLAAIFEVLTGARKR